ncbi:MAG: hypothetical protein Q7T16_03550 [Candidatus Burarchaeum sp.]|nr:hypothetical protein [Candidatus Burarchaeum sp.]MDO8339706.1 hypothetical protein [Candidatus Burarchaeum sp.]
MVNASIITSAGRQKPNDIAVFGMQGAQKRTGTDVLGMGFFHTAFRNRPVNPDKDPKREMDDSEWPSGKRLGERGDRPVNIGKSSDFEHPLENRKSRGSASKKKGSASETKGLVVLEIVGNNDREPIIDLSLKGKDPKKEIRYVKDKIAVANLVAEVRSMTYAEALKNPKQEGVDCLVVSLKDYTTFGNY